MKKEKLEKIVTKMAKCKTKIAGVITSAMVGMPMIVNAGGGMEIAGESKGAAAIVSDIAEIVVNIFPLIGVFFVISGVFKLIMAYRGDNPEQQSAAAKDIVIGAVFIVFRVFAWSAIKGLI